VHLPKPRVGLILLRAEWFDKVVALPALAEEMAADLQVISSTLSHSFDLVGPWVVSTTGSLAQTERALRAADVDLVVFAFQVWAEDYTLVPLLQALGDRPVAVWCFLPWKRPPRPATFTDVLRGSGPIGTLEGMGVMRSLGVDFTFTLGAPDDPRVVADLTRAARVAQVRRALRSAHFGVLPYRNDQMQTTFVDEFRLRVELGPTVEYLSVDELRRTADDLSEAEVRAYLTDLQQEFPVREVSDDTLTTAARASLGLARLAADCHLDVLSLNDITPELHDVLGLRPCLYPPLFDQAGVLVSLEGDLGAATAMFVLNRLTGLPVLFTEIWFWDENDNLIVGGHAGPQNPALARQGCAWISHDFEFAQSDRTEGAHLQFVASPGRVTLFQLRGTPTGWQAIVAAGEAVDTEPWVEGYPHAVVCLDVPVSDFFRRVANVGSTQHWALVHGDVLAEVAAVCSGLGIYLQVIS